MEKEYYLYTFAELTAKIGLEAAIAKVKFYQQMLETYPNTKCLKQSNLLNTYED
jgi:hypothetical protein